MKLFLVISVLILVSSSHSATLDAPESLPQEPVLEKSDISISNQPEVDAVNKPDDIIHPIEQEKEGRNLLVVSEPERIETSPVVVEKHHESIKMIPGVLPSDNVIIAEDVPKHYIAEPIVDSLPVHDVLPAVDRFDSLSSVPVLDDRYIVPTETLDNAESGIVFRPLFAYRQQIAQRRRIYAKPSTTVAPFPITRKPLAYPYRYPSYGYPYYYPQYYVNAPFENVA